MANKTAADAKTEQPVDEVLVETDTDPYLFRGYTFSGGNLGGQSVHTCLDCGALVHETSLSRHQDWHERQAG